MPSAIVKYHRHFLPKGGTFSKEMSGIRKNRATQIKTLRNQVGRKKARATLVSQYKTHVAAVNTEKRQAKRAKQYAPVHAAARAQATKSPRWRKRGGGKVTHYRIPAKNAPKS